MWCSAALCASKQHHLVTATVKRVSNVLLLEIFVVTLCLFVVPFFFVSVFVFHHFVVVLTFCPVSFKLEISLYRGLNAQVCACLYLWP